MKVKNHGDVSGLGIKVEPPEHIPTHIHDGERWLPITDIAWWGYWNAQSDGSRWFRIPAAGKVRAMTEGARRFEYRYG